MRSKGFTLVEVMVTVTIIGILLVLAKPGMGTWRLNTYHYELANTVAAIGRRAATRAWQTGRAHSVELSVDAGGDFLILLKQGMSPKCRQTNWARCDSRVDPLAPAPIQELTAESFRSNAGSGVLSISVAMTKEGDDISPYADWNTAVSAMSVCYEPSGKTYRLQATGPSAGLVLQRSKLIWRIARSATAEGQTLVDRTVIFPPSGIPELRL